MAASLTPVLIAGCLTTSAAAAAPAVKVVPRVDLTRYVGQWYEVARLPMFFQEGCGDSGTSYALKPDGAIEVVNRCRDARDGSLREAKGRAWVVDAATNAKLKVSFFWPFRSDYWIIDLGRDYEYAVVGTPDREHAWILSRTPNPDPRLLEGIVARLREQGFRVENLIWRAGVRPAGM